MHNQSNPSDGQNKNLFELFKLLGHTSEKFAKIAHLKNDYVANYLIGFLGEGDLRLLQEQEYLQIMMNGLIALKWQLMHNISYEITYAKLHDTNPTTQLEFDTVLKELLLLPKIGDGQN
ncbi:MAG: hypothetical protein U0X91_22280 [Spirosomataceae bacterium]